MADHLSDEEQVEALKRWWDENGKQTVISVVVVVGGYLGWNAWQNQQQTQAEAASSLYENLVEVAGIAQQSDLTDEQKSTAAHLIESIKADHASSLYASQASLISARLAVDSDNISGAKTELQWVIDNSSDKELAQLAKIRLTRLLLSEGELDQALVLANDNQTAAFDSLFAELRGDIYIRQAQYTQAKEAYQVAIDTALEDDANRLQLLQVKLTDISSSADGEV